MASLNKVILIGYLGQDPEKRVTSGGHSVVTVSLATTERFNDREGVKQERTEWHRLVFWNKLAEIIEQYCKKGTLLYVEGSIQTKEWLDKDGNKRYTTEVIARSTQILDRLQGGQGQGTSSQAAAPQQGYQNVSPASDPYQVPPAASSQQPAPIAPGQDDFIEDDIPF